MTQAHCSVQRAQWELPGSSHILPLPFSGSLYFPCAQETNYLILFGGTHQHGSYNGMMSSYQQSVGVELRRDWVGIAVGWVRVESELGFGVGWNLAGVDCWERTIFSHAKFNCTLPPPTTPLPTLTATTPQPHGPTRTQPQTPQPNQATPAQPQTIPTQRNPNATQNLILQIGSDPKRLVLSCLPF